MVLSGMQPRTFFITAVLGGATPSAAAPLPVPPPPLLSLKRVGRRPLGQGMARVLWEASWGATEEAMWIYRGAAIHRRHPRW